MLSLLDVINHFFSSFFSISLLIVSLFSHNHFRLSYLRCVDNILLLQPSIFGYVCSDLHHFRLQSAAISINTAILLPRVRCSLSHLVIIWWHICSCYLDRALAFAAYQAAGCRTPRIPLLHQRHVDVSIAHMMLSLLLLSPAAIAGSVFRSVRRGGRWCSRCVACRRNCPVNTILSISIQSSCLCWCQVVS